MTKPDNLCFALFERFEIAMYIERTGAAMPANPIGGILR
jgi:hypothetical protein